MSGMLILCAYIVTTSKIHIPEKRAGKVTNLAYVRKGAFDSYNLAMNHSASNKSKKPDSFN